VITAPAGFVATGLACGIKASGASDLAVVATDDHRPVAAAAVFTSNRMTAAPVLVSRAHLASSGGRAAAVVVNSGNANAATGDEGVEHAERMCAATAAALACAPDTVLVCSTGLIGIPLPIGLIERAMPEAVGRLAGGDDAGVAAAEAMRTTDTHRKDVVVVGDRFTVGGMAKGAAMLAPDMATMLAVLSTDADVPPEVLQRLLADGVRTSFNALSVDGCTSTNDTVIVLASGRAGPVDEADVGAAIAAACRDLAGQMAGDAEGATKVVRLTVTGAASDADAERAARRVADSALVKCSWYGCDPYWGRIASELGSSGAEFDQAKVTIAYGGVVVAKGGVTVAHDEATVHAHMQGRNLVVEADLGLGSGEATLLTNDLSHAYVDENMGTS
jgi:glutamate N-acetyltransferase/amino-acid N-acetyltransferase